MENTLINSKEILYVVITEESIDSDWYEAEVLKRKGFFSSWFSEKEKVTGWTTDFLKSQGIARSTSEVLEKDSRFIRDGAVWNKPNVYIQFRGTNLNITYDSMEELNEYIGDIKNNCELIQFG